MTYGSVCTIIEWYAENYKSEDIMIQSMTGFGRGEASNDRQKITIEIKSVNHRYLDTSVRLPRKLNVFETAVRNKIKEYASRGKVDIFVSFSDTQADCSSITYNREIAAAYCNGMEQMISDFSLKDTITAYQLARFPDVFTMEEQALDEEALENLLMEAMSQAGEQFVYSRKVEGKKLKEDLLEKLDHVQELVEQIAKRSPDIVEEYRNRIREKVSELLGDTKLDEAVLATELVVFADKVCVDEEMVRLKTHIIHMKETLESDGAIGRKLDFLTQEMNRESNTILSKSNDIEVSNYGIELKTEIEKIREQIQNIE